MYSLEIPSTPADRDLLIADLWEQGSAGIVELDDRCVRAFFEDEAGRDDLLARYPGAESRIEEHRDWIAAAREKLPPMLVGRRFFLLPEWRTDAAPDGRLTIIVNPGMAFGTGFHETTQLCLEALEDCVTPDSAVLDVGTGSGILAEAARLLGAAHVYGCDNDPVAVDLAKPRVPFAFTGSADAVRSAVADVVVANISPEAILALAPDLLRTLRPGGTALFSGFELHEVETVRAALPPAKEVRTKGNWALIICRR
jgi:ribosomal protein L11 methyltransferase